MIESLLMGAYQLLAVVLGASMGSFLHVVVDRLPDNRSLREPSSCPHCGKRLRPWELVPVLGFAFLRGRCADCKRRIHVSYVLLEILVGALAWLLFRRVFDGWIDLDLAHVLAWLTAFVFICLLVVAAYVDLRHHIVPDEVSIYAVPIGVLLSWLTSLAGYDGWPTVTWMSSIAGAASGGLLTGAVALVGMRVFGREALGWGDVKLTAMIGSFLGLVPGVWLVVGWAGLLGAAVGLAHLVVTRKRSYLPFGPVLALAAISYVLYGDVTLDALFPGIVRFAADLTQYGL